MGNGSHRVVAFDGGYKDQEGPSAIQIGFSEVASPEAAPRQVLFLLLFGYAICPNKLFTDCEKVDCVNLPFLKVFIYTL